LSAGGSVGDADSLGGQPASAYLRKADSTIVSAGYGISVSQSGHTATVTADTSVLVNKAGTQVISGTKIFTAPQYLNDSLILSMPSGDSVSSAIKFNTLDGMDWRIYGHNAVFNGITDRTLQFGYNVNPRTLSKIDSMKHQFKMTIESEYYNGIDTVSEWNIDLITPNYSTFQYSINPRAVYLQMNKYNAATSWEFWANSFIIYDTSNTRTRKVFSIYNNDSVVIDNRGIFKVRNAGSGSSIQIIGDSSNVKDLGWYSRKSNGDSARFIMRISGSETGSNVGGDFTLLRRADNASALGTSLTIARSSGNWTFENSKTYAFGGSSSLTGGSWSGTTGVFSSTLSATTGTFTGDIVLTGSMYSADNTSSLTVSGGSGTGAGANIILYGGAEASSAGDINMRSGTTSKLLFDLSASLWTFSTPVTLGSNAFTSGAITTSSFIDGGSALTDTSSFSTTETRKAVAISGAVASDKYTVSIRNANGDDTLPVEYLSYYAKADSLIVLRNAGTTSGLKFSYIRIK